MIRLYNMSSGIIIEKNKEHFLIEHRSWDDVVNTPDLYSWLESWIKKDLQLDSLTWASYGDKILAPIQSQEVWASGVTYLRSRDARMEESEHAKSAYDLVYEADRPELFFKSLPHRVAGPHQKVNIRKDSTWNVPEPELTLFINSSGHIAGYTCGNDMSSRSIEGENTLYLPQAKTYERSAALGPCLLILNHPIDSSTTINLKIFRQNDCVFQGHTRLNTMKRKLEDLKDYLLRGLKFEYGCYLMTGTGVVPPTTFTLNGGDVVEISIDGIGVLENEVAWF
ncbi:MAG: fumarylacetoacetate hydrolase family protein [Saprospiraceae bacterium]